MNIKKLDTVFSTYIRMKNADQNGYCKCVSCGKMQKWVDVDAGHYVNRKFLSVRWNEINVQPQCRACNRFSEGNIPEFGIALQEKYGEDIIKKLLVLKNQSTRFTQFEINIMTDHYKKKIKELCSN